MRTARVLFVTVQGPAGQVDVAAREDVTLSQVVNAVGGAIGATPGVAPLTIWSAVPQGPASGDGRTAVVPDLTLAQAGALDGDVLAVDAVDSPDAAGAIIGDNGMVDQ